MVIDREGGQPLTKDGGKSKKFLTSRYIRRRAAAADTVAECLLLVRVQSVKDG